MSTQNEGVAEEERLEFRVGVNLGEVIHDRDDIYGDGVNLAARIQELAKFLTSGHERNTVTERVTTLIIADNEESVFRQPLWCRDANGRRDQASPARPIPSKRKLPGSGVVRTCSTIGTWRIETCPEFRNVRPVTKASGSVGSKPSPGSMPSMLNDEKPSGSMVKKSNGVPANRGKTAPPTSRSNKASPPGSGLGTTTEAKLGPLSTKTRNPRRSAGR